MRGRPQHTCGMPTQQLDRAGILPVWRLWPVATACAHCASRQPSSSRLARLLCRTPTAPVRARFLGARFLTFLPALCCSNPNCADGAWGIWGLRCATRTCLGMHPGNPLKHGTAYVYLHASLSGPSIWVQTCEAVDGREWWWWGRETYGRLLMVGRLLVAQLCTIALRLDALFGSRRCRSSDRTLPPPACCKACSA